MHILLSAVSRRAEDLSDDDGWTALTVASVQGAMGYVLCCADSLRFRLRGREF